MNETTYFCWKCKTKTHWANETCPKDAAKGVDIRAASGVEKSGGGLSDDSPGRVDSKEPVVERVLPRRGGESKAAPFDRKAYQREYMRKYRQRRKK